MKLILKKVKNSIPYPFTVFSGNELNKRIRVVSKFIKKNKYNTSHYFYVVTGTSGTFIMGSLKMIMPELQVLHLFSDKSNHRKEYEYDKCINKNTKFIFIDDFIHKGKTINKVFNEITIKEIDRKLFGVILLDERYPEYKFKNKEKIFEDLNFLFSFSGSVKKDVSKEINFKDIGKK